MLGCGRPLIDEGLALEEFAQPNQAARRRVPAWLLSALLHAALWILGALLLAGPSRGVRVEPPRSGGIVLIRPPRDADQAAESPNSPTTTAPTKDGVAADTADGQVKAQAAAPPTGQAATPPDLADALPAPAERPVDPATLLPSLVDAQEMIEQPGETISRADSLTKGAAPDRRIGRATHTYVFGAKGEGSAFVYVFDRSDSMNDFQGRPLAAAKAELINSLQRLRSVHQFQIIFYTTDVIAFNPSPSQPPRMMFATDENKALAGRFVQESHAYNGTEHMKPLSLALRLAPDVIFLLTDAGEPPLSETNLQALRRLNSGTVINTIEFGVGPSPGDDNFLVRLAQQNDGQHVYVDVTRLPRP